MLTNYMEDVEKQFLFETHPSPKAEANEFDIRNATSQPNDFDVRKETSESYGRAAHLERIKAFISDTKNKLYRSLQKRKAARKTTQPVAESLKEKRSDSSKPKVPERQKQSPGRKVRSGLTDDEKNRIFRTALMFGVLAAVC